MSLETGQEILVHIARALMPVTNYVRPLVGDNWAYIPAFVICFMQLFSVAMLWVRYVNIGSKKSSPFLGSCAMSRSVHVAVVSFLLFLIFHLDTFTNAFVRICAVSML
jgi:hypothetical protein